jgi:5-methylcytosine-specific restriction endonuclease McrA
VYREATKEHVQQYGKEYRESHKEEINNKSKLWRRNNVERCAAQSAEWAKNNGDKLRAATKRYAKLHPERVNYHTQLRRVRKKGLDGTITPQDIYAILVLQTNKCVYCNQEFSEVLPATLDHIIPISREGASHTASNAQMLCKACNSSKKDKTHEEYVEYLRIVFPDRYEKFKEAA